MNDIDHTLVRASDPNNSLLAAIGANLKHSRSVVYAILNAYGPASDERIAELNDEHGFSTYDPSRLRHGRKDLVDANIVKQVGDTTSKRGRTTAVWAIDKPENSLF